VLDETPQLVLDYDIVRGASSLQIVRLIVLHLWQGNLIEPRALLLSLAPLHLHLIQVLTSFDHITTRLHVLDFAPEFKFETLDNIAAPRVVAVHRDWYNLTRSKDLRLQSDFSA
jgi:hypothetical protein